MWFSVIGSIVTLTLSLLAMSLTAMAQPAGKLPRIGVLVPGLATGTNRGVETFRQGLRELGYVEDQTIALEVRWDEHTPERWPSTLPPWSGCPWTSSSRAGSMRLWRRSTPPRPCRSSWRPRAAAIPSRRG